VTVERHIGGRRYLTDVPVNGDLSLREVAAFFAVDPATVWRWVRAGRLDARKERGRLHVPIREVFRFQRREFGPWLSGWWKRNAARSTLGAAKTPYPPAGWWRHYGAVWR